MSELGATHGVHLDSDQAMEAAVRGRGGLTEKKLRAYGLNPVTLATEISPSKPTTFGDSNAAGKSSLIFSYFRPRYRDGHS